MLRVRGETHPGCAAATVVRISAYGTILRAAQALPSKGMYSMKRTLMSASRVSATKSSSSSSFTPRITTQFTFTGAKPAASAARTEASTRSWPVRRVSSSNLAGTSVSRLMFTAVMPALRSAGSFLASTMPLEVMPKSRNPDSRPRRVAMSSRSARTVGSPPAEDLAKGVSGAGPQLLHAETGAPVSLIFVTPDATNRRAMRSICGHAGAVAVASAPRRRKQVRRAARRDAPPSRSAAACWA